MFVIRGPSHRYYHEVFVRPAKACAEWPNLHVREIGFRTHLSARKSRS